ncbi:hypothetical protein CFAM422_008944 [Trichoderma lentiforme]|uniref:NACHT domain-containing protein n=1 Tax=Trichoderma lentiforme TaxID=1567552 RepID=A0A9P5CC22_9HYPO|nr:hypothetical protein CFAM422_008944 [Trichoderma lentiforme]
MAARKPSRPFYREDFEIAIVCAKDTEYNAVCHLVDEFWDEDGDPFGRAIGDKNIYTTGCMGGLNIVLVLLCNPGKAIAAGTAASLRSSYPGIKLLLLTGICAGVPNAEGKELLLGDVVIGGTVIQYDLGECYTNNFVERNTLEDRLSRPDKNIRNLIAVLKTEVGLHRLEDKVSFYLRKIQDQASKERHQPRDKDKANYQFPGSLNDVLFISAYVHKHYMSTQCMQCNSLTSTKSSPCDESKELPCTQTGCDDTYLVPRKRLRYKKVLEDNGDHLASQQPSVFIGRFGSGDTVFNSGIERDRVAQKHQILAFETEGAGIWDELPCIIVKGVSTYGDGHKMSADWDNFAAATAASAVRGLIDRYPQSDKLPSVNYKDEVDQACLRDLYITSPPDDKARIEQIKGGLLHDVYAWVLDNDAYKQWHHNNDNQTSLLWIKGDPGKGKTMLLCGLINELQSVSGNLCYFLCQATDSRLNNASSILRGLLHMLISKQPLLISYLRTTYSRFGKSLFEDSNSWINLSQIFLNMLQDPAVKDLTIIVDAVDECLADLPQFLNFIQRSSTLQVKWLISSRNETDIQDILLFHTSKQIISLELNTTYISSAISLYIEFKVNSLSKVKGYTTAIKNSVQDYLLQNADGTFLWVSLVCELLEKAPSFDPLPKSAEYPRGLDNLYERMIEKVLNNELDWGRRILAISTVARRPLSLQEFETLNPFPSNVVNKEILEKRWEEALGYCGSFLTKRNGIIYFVHQSAKSFILEKASARLFSGGIELVHKHIFSISMSALTTVLKRDMHKLIKPGFLLNDLDNTPSPDPLVAVRYCCIYWIDHFEDSISQAGGTKGHETIYQFLLKKYIYWLEALSLLRSMHYVWDAHRFIQMFGKVIQDAPLQVYVSALLFSPSKSIIRQSFQTESPYWVRILPNTPKDWTSCVKKFDDPYKRDSFSSLEVSCCDTWIAAPGSRDIQIWDVKTGRLVRKIEAWQSGYVFSPRNDNELAAVDIDRKRLTIWDVSSGQLIQQLALPPQTRVRDISFFYSEPGMLGARLKDDDQNSIITMWNIATSERTRTVLMKGDSNCFKFSPFGGKVLYAYFECGENNFITHAIHRATHGRHCGDLIICSIDKASIIHTSTFGDLHGFTFSPLGECIAALFKPSSEADCIIMLLNTTTKEIFRKIELPSQLGGEMAFAPNGDLLAVSMEGVVGLWNIRSGQCLQKIEGESYYLAFSHDGKWLFSGSSVSIHVIEVGRKEMFSPDPYQRSRPGEVLISPRGDLVATWRKDVLKLWRLDSMAPMHELRGARSGELWAGDHWEFSPDSTKIFSKSQLSLKLWDISSTIEKQILDITEPWISGSYFYPERGMTFLDETSGFKTAIFSPNSRFLAASRTVPRPPNISSSWGSNSSWGSKCTHIKVWDTVSGKLLMLLKSEPIFGMDLKFSPDSKRIAISLHFDNNGIKTTRIEVWDITSSSGTSSMVLSHSKLTDHLQKKMEELENENYKSQSIPDPLSFLSDRYLAFKYRHYRDGTKLSDVIIQIVLSISPSIMPRSEINDEAILTTEKSSFDIGSLGSWVTLDGERLIWLPPEYRGERTKHVRFNCVATSNGSRPLSILKFCCSNCPRQVIALDGPTGCTSNSSAEDHTYKQKVEGDFIILRLDMDSPDHEMLELDREMLELDREMLELDREMLELDREMLELDREMMEPEAKKKGTLRKGWHQFKARFLNSKD